MTLRSPSDKPRVDVDLSSGDARRLAAAAALSSVAAAGMDHQAQSRVIVAYLCNARQVRFYQMKPGQTLCTPDWACPCIVRREGHYQLQQQAPGQSADRRRSSAHDEVGTACPGAGDIRAMRSVLLLLLLLLLLQLQLQYYYCHSPDAMRSVWYARSSSAAAVAACCSPAR